MIWLLIGYMWLCVHRPFEEWWILATWHVERVYMIATIAYWLTTGPSLPAGNRLHRSFAAYILVIIASWVLGPYQSSGVETVENYVKYAVFYVLLVTSVRDSRDLHIILAGYLGAMTLFMLHSVREFYNGRATWQQGVLRLIPIGNTYDFNDFAGLIVTSLPIAWVLWRHSSGWKKQAVVLGYVGLSCFCVYMTGSRMGFVGVVLASLMACLASPKRWRLLACLPVLFMVAWAVLPEKHKDRYMTLFDPEHKSAGGTTGGDLRYAGFAQGLKLLEERPVLGFGPNSMRFINGIMPHNLYGQLLGELGIAGALTFGFVLVGFAQNTFEARRLAQQLDPASDQLPWHAVAGVGAAILLLAIMAWGFNFLYWHVWLWFGGFQVVALQLLKEQFAGGQSAEEQDTQSEIVDGDREWALTAR